MINKVNKIENPSKNVTKQFRDVIFTLSLAGLIGTGTQVNAESNGIDSIYEGMLNNTTATTPNINGKKCYVRDDIINNQEKNKNIYSLPVYNKNTQLGLSTEGEIANAHIEIYDNTGRFAYFGVTDSEGRLIIDKELLISNLGFLGYEVKNFDNYNQVFTIKVKRGNIQDKNMDFCTDNYPITTRGNYSITGTINQLNNSTVSRISTLVENIINGPDNSNLKYYVENNGLNPKINDDINLIYNNYNNTVQRILNGLVVSYGLKNVNHDNLIDYNDVYKFSDLQFLTQKTLDTYIGFIRNGDEKSKQNRTSQIKINMNLIVINTEILGKDYIVTLDSYMKGSKIIYSYFKDFSKPISYTVGQELIISDGETIYIRENYSDTNTSGTISKLEFNNGKLYRDANIISSIIVNNSVGGTSGNTTNTNTGAQANGGNTGNNTTNPIVNNGKGSYTNIDTNNSKTINTIDESLDIVISQIQKEISADNSSTILQKILDEITSIEKEIEALKEKSAKNNTIKTNVQNELYQLTQKLTSLKQTLTNSYNKLDNNAKVLLESTLGTNQKQDAVNSILSRTQTKTAKVGTKTYDKLPNKAQIKVSLDLLNTKAVELNRDVNTLKQILDRLEGIYKTKQKEYQDSVNVYNQYQTDKSKYQQVLQNFNTVFGPLKSQGTFKNLNLNVGSIVTKYGVNRAINDLNSRLNETRIPENRYYALDKKTRGLKDTGDKDFMSLMGYRATINTDYGNNLSYPATIKLKLNGSVIKSFTVNNSQNSKAVIDYMYKLVERQVASNELNKLLAIENEKKEIAKRVLDNTGQYKQIKVLGQDYYRSAEIDYQKAKTNYDNIKSKYDFKNNLLNGYKNLISNYGTGINNVEATNAQVTEKKGNIKLVEVNIKETIEALGVKETSIKQKQQEFSNGVKSLASNFLTTYKTNPNTSNNTKQFADYPRCYVEMKNGYTPVYKNRNGDVFRGNQTAIDNNKYIKHPFTIYVRFNIDGSGYDYPAEVWVEYKENAGDQFSHPTETIKINSRKEFDNREAIMMLAKKAMSDITLLRLNKTNDNKSTKKESPVTDTLKLTITDLVKKLDKQYNIQEKNYLAKYISKYLIYKVEKIQLEVQFGLGFTTGYGKAIYDTAEYLESLTFIKLKTLLGNIWNTLSDSTEYGLNISKYWNTLISYTTNKNPGDLQKLNDLEKKLSFAPEIIYAKNLLTSIDWDRFEDKSYWIGYYTGYLAENVLVSKGVGAGTSFANKLLNISKLSQKLKYAGVIGNLTSLEKVIILQDKLIKGSKNWNVADIQTIANKTNNPSLIYNQFDNGEIYKIYYRGGDILFLAKGKPTNGFEHIFITGRGGVDNLTRYEQLYKTQNVTLNNWLKKEPGYGYEIDSPDNMMRFINDIINKGVKETKPGIEGFSYILEMKSIKRTMVVGFGTNGYLTTITYK
ncbi:MAG: hypothetical protein PHS49_07575 [Candidatus Gracilibacteria bacterium]|nr:hypothetical protein [Candidatus Gracilibacteria bacterium]